MHDLSSATRRASRDEQERLFTSDTGWEEMADRSAIGKSTATHDHIASRATAIGQGSDLNGPPPYNEEGQMPRPVYRVYKRRWFGLMQLVLMNIIVSWD
ncbi:MAG: hypothetical protein Q9207_003834, partial [Kuettlingeria erythrocarpa]